MLYPTELRADMKKAHRVSFFVDFLVGVQGFEPWTPWSQTRCATRLRHTPMITNYRLEKRASNQQSVFLPWLARKTDVLDCFEVVTHAGQISQPVACQVPGSNHW